MTGTYDEIDAALSKLHQLVTAFHTVAELRRLEAQMGQLSDSLNGSIKALADDIGDVPNRVAAVVSNAVAAAVGPLNDQITAKDATIADLTAQVATLTAAAGDTVTADQVTALGNAKGTLDTALPPVTAPAP